MERPRSAAAALLLLAALRGISDRFDSQQEIDAANVELTR
jgi:hypothetical protein